MKTLKYITNDGYILLSPKGNTYVGKSANDVLCQVFIKHNIDTHHAQKDALDFAVKHNKLMTE